MYMNTYLLCMRMHAAREMLGNKMAYNTCILCVRMHAACEIVANEDDV